MLPKIRWGLLTVSYQEEGWFCSERVKQWQEIQRSRLRSDFRPTIWQLCDNCKASLYLKKYWAWNIIKRRGAIGLSSVPHHSFSTPHYRLRFTEIAHPGAFRHKRRVGFHFSLRGTIRSQYIPNSLKAIIPKMNLADCYKESALHFFVC